MKRRISIPVGDAGKDVIRVGEAADGAWTFLKEGAPCGWCRKVTGGRWMLFTRSYVRFFPTLAALLDCVDCEIGG